MKWQDSEVRTKVLLYIHPVGPFSESYKLNQKVENAFGIREICLFARGMANFKKPS